MQYISLVAFYGEKKHPFFDVISKNITFLRDRLGDTFIPYAVEQIHATIVDLRASRTDSPHSTSLSSLINFNFMDLRNRQVHMDLVNFVSFVNNTEILPLTVQIGGFGPNDIPFRSRNKLPYERSFSFQNDKAVMMGWPIDVANNRFPNSLDDFRKACEQYNILHGYYISPTDFDNDLYFRLGFLDIHKANNDVLQEVKNASREMLASSSPVLLNVGLDDLYIVSSESETFPIDSTLVRNIQDVDSSFLQTLYGPIFMSS